jgi:hypothetical protein
MQDQVNASQRVPWNKGKLTGAKPPLRPKHVWSIRTKLQIEGRARDLAMFNLAIDSKLRGCDVVVIRVEDVAAGGYTADRATVRSPVAEVLTQYDNAPICPIVSDWIGSVGLDPRLFGTHSLRRTKATLMYRRTRNLRAARRRCQRPPKRLGRRSAPALRPGFVL